MWVALSVQATFEDVRVKLESWFPVATVGDLDQLVEEPPETPWPPIVINLDSNESEFPICIRFCLFPALREEAAVLPVMIELARRFSSAYGCRTICDGSGYGDSPSPYWSIIWEAGKSYLANDSSTMFGDGEGGEVAIVREVQIPRVILDAAGHIFA